MSAPQATEEPETAAMERKPPVCSVVFLLAGGLRQSAIDAALGYSGLLMPLAADKSRLASWVDAVGACGVASRVAALTGGADQFGTERIDGAEILADEDPYRGPAGVVRDARDRLAIEGTCFVAEGSRTPPTSRDATALLQAHATSGNSVTIAIDPGGHFAGMLMVDSSFLDLVPPRGFMDLKEQWLDRVHAEGGRIGMHAFADPTSRISTVREYFAALDEREAWNRIPDPRALVARVGAVTRLARTECLIESGVTLRSGVRCYRSVVCRGATVGSEAVLIRSVVAQHATVMPSEVLVDTVRRRDG